MKIAITGHRPNKLGNDYELTSPLIKRIKNEIFNIVDKIQVERKVQNDTVFITGMALGIDTLFALFAIEYHIPFIAAIPCLNQEKRWPQKSQDRYKQILSSSLCTIEQVSTREYNHSCMQMRNIWMVDNCDVLIAVWDGTAGGTANCVKYAHEQGKEIIHIDLRNITIQI